MLVGLNPAGVAGDTRISSSSEVEMALRRCANDRLKLSASDSASVRMPGVGGSAVTDVVRMRTGTVTEAVMGAGRTVRVGLDGVEGVPTWVMLDPELLLLEHVDASRLGVDSDFLR